MLELAASLRLPAVEAQLADRDKRISELKARVAELEGALNRAAGDFHEARRKLLDNNTSLWETQQFLIESKRRCLTVLGKWDDGPKETT